ncbi:extracellular solute-binding protein [Paenibacillus filicis]|uniref:Extracellular solute-binding protein n=1 Tax=Paenibacillus gyeongsangnamensis TaxID=3388067 RepID=A0ABT4Q2Q6_9BACL|nr:extracellular solute-binding protein [Paenibacillus filicis]MCZ8511093.1 extracellular solute-binding protein [Paenibacillus filicis]
MNRHKMKRLVSGAVMTTLAMSVAACSPGAGKPAEGGGGKAASGKDGPLDISIMAPIFKTTYPKDHSPVAAELEKYTNANIHFEWTPNSSYGDKFNITLASGKLPTVMVALDKGASFVNAVRSGAFWELGPYLKDYPNLSKANPIVLNNTSIDGKIYGVYRARALGRNAIVYRKDWLENLNMQPPKTIDDFYQMLKAFTYNDPDKNGKNDTYGMVVSKWTGGWAGPLDQIALWFGAPNKWGEDAGGKLQPAFLTKEYMDALKFMKKLYDEKLINQDFAVFDTAKYNDPLNNSQAGVIVDVADAAARIEDKIHQAQEKAGKDDKSKQFMDVVGSVSGPKGLRALPTSGYAGMIAISKSGAKTEKELRQVLGFLDKMNDEKAQILSGNGIEGKHYTKVQGGVEPSKDTNLLESELEGLNQILNFLPEDRTLKVVQTPIRQKQDQVQKENEKIVVPNPAEPLISNVYTQKGPQLDNIINDARVKFIVGQINEAGYQAALDLWKKSGGDDYVKEINELYSKSKSK